MVEVTTLVRTTLSCGLLGVHDRDVRVGCARAAADFKRPSLRRTRKQRGCDRTSRTDNCARVGTEPWLVGWRADDAGAGGPYAYKLERLASYDRPVGDDSSLDVDLWHPRHASLLINLIGG